MRDLTRNTDLRATLIVITGSDLWIRRRWLRDSVCSRLKAKREHNMFHPAVVEAQPAATTSRYLVGSVNPTVFSRRLQPEAVRVTHVPPML
jgi:hypothetical protein